jgi:hypothetical protein
MRSERVGRYLERAKGVVSFGVLESLNGTVEI